jgi:hypothetical protein
LPHEGGLRARVTVVVAVRHQDRPELEKIERTIDVPASDPATDTVALSLSLSLSPGINLVGVAVRDDSTREASFVSTTLDLPAAKGGGRGAARR